ncbi:MAG: hypothetical protein J6D16_06610 [Clostridia bacterium]|nr:hypothetical protein [Clostridia bacterium]
MKKYESPKACVITRGDMDIICASELLFPIIPLMGGTGASENDLDNV